MNEKADSPLIAAKAVKERVTLPSFEERFSNRRWVINKDGHLEERYGPPQEGDHDVVRTVP